MMRHFVADYEAEYGVPPDTAFAALAYDADMLVASAIERAGSAKQKEIADTIELTDGFPGVTGAISFTPGTHIPEKEVTIVNIVGRQADFDAMISRKKSLLHRSVLFQIVDGSTTFFGGE